MPAKNLQLIYEDDAIVMVNKEPGLLTLGDRYAPNKMNLVKALEDRFGKIFVVHRLDKETSGIMVFAKTAEAHRSLSIDFEKRSVSKFYLSLLEGKMHQEEIEVNKPIAPSPSQKNRMIISKNGKEARSIFRLKERFRNFSLAEIEIFSGRTHQIRVHAESIGYPLAVDSIYGKRPALFASEIKGSKFRAKKDKEERPLISRSILHACKIQFKHPVTNEAMSFEAELPKDFRAVVNQLRKWNLEK